MNIQKPGRARWCALCQEPHWADLCTTYKTVGARVDKAVELKLCFKCLRNSHRTSDCKARGSCFQCKGPHNSAFCSEVPTKHVQSVECIQLSAKQREKRLVSSPSSNSATVPQISETTDNSQSGTKCQGTDEEMSATATLLLRKESPALTDFAEETTLRFPAAEATSGIKPKQSGSAAVLGTSVTVTSKGSRNPTTPGRAPYCAFCQQQHWTHSCSLYQTVDDRLRRAKEMKLCFKCLRKNHQAFECKVLGCCYYCKGAHNSALCHKTQRNDTDVEAEKRDCSGATAAEKKGSVQIKWKYNETFYRFELALQSGYATLMDKVKSKVPEFVGCLGWQDEDGDMVTLSSNEDFAYAASMPANQQVMRLFTVDDGAVLRAQTDRTEELKTNRHVGSATVQGVADKLEELECDRNSKVQDLKQKLAELEDQFICKICSERRVDVAYQCGHTICSKCDGRICANSIERYWERSLCSFCRKEVVSRIHIFN